MCVCVCAVVPRAKCVYPCVGVGWSVRCSEARGGRGAIAPCGAQSHVSSRLRRLVTGAQRNNARFGETSFSYVSR